jgi:hypothetical protein
MSYKVNIVKRTKKIIFDLQTTFTTNVNNQKEAKYSKIALTALLTQ